MRRKQEQNIWKQEDGVAVHVSELNEADLWLRSKVRECAARRERNCDVQ